MDAVQQSTSTAAQTLQKMDPKYHFPVTYYKHIHLVDQKSHLRAACYFRIEF